MVEKQRASGSAAVRRGPRQRATALAELISESSLHPAVLEEMRRRPAREPVAIACSGGADSVALLSLLWTHLPERRGQWLVLHFDHRLRGRAATADAALVQRLARGLGETCVIGRWTDAPARASEAAARTARWGFFNDAMRTAGARVIALGHHANDVAETMLMRLVRGSGSGGLAAPRPVQRLRDGSVRVRPLLNLPAKDIRSALRRAKITWREDATNETDDYLRNRIRRRVLPALLSAADRDALAAIGHTRAILEDDDVALEAWLDELLTTPVRNTSFDVASLRGRPRALARRAVHRWLQAIGFDAAPSKAVVASLAGAIVAGRDHRVSVGPGRWLVLVSSALKLESAKSPLEPWPAARLAPGGQLLGPRGDRLAARWVRLTSRLRTRIESGEFPHDTTAHLSPPPGWVGWWEVRNWRRGDRYRALGAPGSRKLQDVFVDRRVARELRLLLPVVVVPEGIIAWVPGLPVADAVGIQPSAKLVVQLTYTPPPPMVNRPIDPISYDA